MSRETPRSFWVTGDSRFPLDMLRYDSCYPAAQDDVSKLEDVTYRGEIGKPVCIQLHTKTATSPTPARWQSFGWIVNEYGPSVLDKFATT